jgi:hypothetical protein
MPIPKKWACQSGDEVCTVEIEDDRMATDEPIVVTLYTEHYDGTDDHATLCCATPEQAREMAAALIHYADAAERRNRADSAAKSPA